MCFLSTNDLSETEHLRISQQRGKMPLDTFLDKLGDFRLYCYFDREGNPKSNKISLYTLEQKVRFREDETFLTIRDVNLNVLFESRNIYCRHSTYLF